jgi:predicted negative regulator of RcsB-dependent stress response
MLEADLARDPAYTEPRSELALADVWMGDVFAPQGSTAESLAKYRKGLVLLQKLAADGRSGNLESSRVQYSSIAHPRIGAILAKIGQPDAAGEEYRRVLQIAEPVTATPHIL